MLKTILILPDGREVSSGSLPAVRSFSLSQQVNEGVDLCPGAACAGVVEIELLCPGELPGLTDGEVTIYRQDDSGNRHKVGLFTPEKPTRPTANTLRFTAYDRMTRLDRELGEWLEGLTGWPYSLYDLAAMVCQTCGLPLKNTEIPMGELTVEKFSPGTVTGRQLIRWIAQLLGRFCRITPEGELEFAWFTPREDASIGPSPLSGQEIGVDWEAGALKLTGQTLGASAAGGDLLLNSPQVRASREGEQLLLAFTAYHVRYFYFQNTLSAADEPITPVEQVHLRQTPTDVGTVYPDGSTGENICCLTGNPLLGGLSAAGKLAAAAHLYEQLRSAVYTPCKVTIAAGLHILPGDIITVTDKKGVSRTLYVMKKTQRGQRNTLECTGNPRRDGAEAFNSRMEAGVSGKILQLQMDMDGLRLQNADGDKKAASLALTVDGLSSEVRRQQDTLSGFSASLTALRQEADQVFLEIGSIRDNGVSRVETTTGYTFSEDGLRIAKSGGEMENRLDHKGMYVTRAGEVLLRADSAGVTAADVQVRNYLCVGDHARFEDYTPGRTGCFYI